MKRILSLLLAVTLFASIFAFSAKASESAVMATYPIECDKTLSFENISLAPREISVLGNDIDYVIYYKDGSVQTYVKKDSPDTISVPAEGKVVITSTSRTVNAVVEDDYFIVDEQENPVFHRVYLNLYESYTFTNTSAVTYKVLYRKNGVNCGFDYVLYDADGNVTKYKNDVLQDIEVPAGYSLKVTQVGYHGQELCALYEKFDMAKNDQPVMKNVKLSAGESYTFTNTSTVTYKVLYRVNGAYCGFDYVLYDANGNVTKYKNDVLQDIEVPAGYSLKVTQVGYHGQELCALYEKFNVVKNDQPVIKRVKLSAGESYTFTNASAVTYKVLYSINGAYCGFDYVLYDANGNVTKYENEVCKDIEVPAGYSLKVTQVGYHGQELCALYEKFNVVKNDQPVIKRIKLSAGESYTFTNTSTVTYKVLYRVNGAYCGFDYVLYDANGNVTKYKNDVLQDIEVPAGYSLKVTQVGYHGQELCALHEAFTWTNDTSTRTYKIVNDDTVNATLVVKSNYSYDYVMYDADNALVAYSVAQTANLVIPSGGYILATVNTNADEPFESNSSLSFEEKTTPVYKAIAFDLGDTYKFTNNGSRELRVYKNGVACDYVIYNADGSINSYANSASNEFFTVPVAGSIHITACDYVRFKLINEYFTAEKLNGSVFGKVFSELGENYQYVNNSAKEVNLLLKGGAYDYVIYDAYGNASAAKMNATASSLPVPTNCKCVITPLDEKLSINALNSAFSAVTKRNYPVFKRVNLLFGETVSMSNLDDAVHTVYASPVNFVNWISYDKNGEIKNSKELVEPQSIEVPENGKIEVTARNSNVSLGGLYEFFSDEDLSVSVTGIVLSANRLTLAKGKQKLLTATVMPEDATNKTVVFSSSDPAVVAVAQTGKITAKSAGTATITVKTADGGYTAFCVVTVTDGTTTVAVTSVALNKTTATLDVGDSVTLTATVAPENATNKAVLWTSSDNTVATVENGVVTAKSAGTATITATTEDGAKSAACVVTVNAAVNEDAPTIAVGTVKAKAGETVSVPLTIEDNTGIAGMVMSLKYSEHLTLTEISPSGALTGLTFTKPGRFDDNPINLTWDGQDADVSNGEILVLTFTVDENAPAGEYPISLKYNMGDIYDGDLNDIEVNLVSGGVTIPAYTPGDVNDDGIINTKDLTLIRRHIAGGYDITLILEAADVNADGIINTKDLTLIRRYIAGGYDVVLK